jgi:hypothetical protein
MATTITLKVKDEQGNVIKNQHVIEDINLIQFEQMMGTIKEIIKEMKNDESLSDLLSNILDGTSKDEENPEELVKQLDNDFVLKLANSFETLAVRMPQQAFKLLSVLSGVELDILRQQKFIDVLDIYDAILEEKDLERLISRVKKSLALTGAKLKFQSLIKRATLK